MSSPPPSQPARKAADAPVALGVRTLARRLPDSHILVLAAAGGASTVACVLAAVAGLLPAAVFAAASALLAFGRLVAEHRRASSASHALIGQAASSAETGRRLAIYERETGLLAYWYVSLRGAEECDRSARYKRPLTLLLAEPGPGADARLLCDQLAEWARRQVRTVDITSYLGNGRFLVLMPETDSTGAWRVVTRLHRDVAGAETGLSRLPADGITFDQLYAVALERLGEPRSQAASA